MGLLDFGAKIVAEYRADTKDIKGKLRELSGEEKKLAEQRLKEAEAHNAQLEGQIKKIGKVALAIGAAGAAIAVGRAGFQAYERESRLSMAAAGANIDKLSKAAGGLATRMELLEFAAKAQHGAFKLTGEQMETAQKAILAITRAGYEHEEVTNKVTEALVKGNAGALDDFGILVRSGSSDLENFNILMEALAKKAGEAGGSTGGAGESVQRAGVEFENAFDKIKTSIGAMVVALEPLVSLVAKLATSVAWVVDTGAGLGNAGDEIEGVFEKKLEFARRNGLVFDIKTGQFVAKDPSGGFSSGTWTSYLQNQARIENRNQESQVLLGGFGQFGRDLVGAGQGLGGGAVDTLSGLERRKGGRGSGRASTDWGRYQYDAVTSGISSGGLGMAAAAYDPKADLDRVRVAEEQNNRIQALTDSWYQRLDFQGPSLLDRVLGSVTTIDAQTAALRGLTGTWDAFAGGVSAGYSAMVDGSTSFGKAFKQATADSLKAMGAEMAVNAVKETGLGIAALAIGGPIAGASAAAHFKSAAVFAGRAALAGVAARGLGAGSGDGAGGGGSAAAASGARSYASSAGGGGNSEPTRIIVYADAFAEDSERSKRLQAEKIVKRAYGSGAVENN